MKRFLIIFLLCLVSTSVYSQAIRSTPPPTWDNVLNKPAWTNTVDDRLAALESGAKRWGICIAKDVVDPFDRVEYMYDAVGMKPAKMDFANNVFDYGDWEDFCTAYNRPVMLNPDGTVAYELDRDDQTKKKDGTASDITSTAHDMNAMSEFKLLWLKQWEDDDYNYVVFSNKKITPEYTAFAFTNAAGEVQDAMYYAMYEGSYTDPKLRSLANGSVMVSQTGQDEITRAEANGAGWYTTYKSQRDYITYLHWLISKSNDDFVAFGGGNNSGGAYIAPGALKNKGQFFGYNTNNQTVKTFYIENYWGNYWMRCAGMLLDLDGRIHVKMTPPYPQPALPDENVMPTGYTNTGLSVSGGSGTYVRYMATHPTHGLVPYTAGATEGQYFTCGLWHAAEPTIKWARVGGVRGDGARCGAGAVNLPDPLSNSSTGIGASLSFLKPPANP